MTAPSVWFDADHCCAACGYPTAAHRDIRDHWVGCNGAERVFELRHRLAQQLAASLHQGHGQQQSQVRRLHAVQSDRVRTRATSGNR